MSARLPEFADLLRYADQRILLEGEIELGKMPRLLSSLTSSEGSVKVSLEFGVDEQRIRFMRGAISTDLLLCCQRCMEPVEYPVAIEIAFALVKGEAEAERLPEGYEPYIVPEELPALAEIVEDELILALPIVARHEGETVCAPQRHSTDDNVEPQQVAEQDERENPFAILSGLKKH